jgi:hypothetical protein
VSVSSTGRSAPGGADFDPTPTDDAPPAPPAPPAAPAAAPAAGPGGSRGSVAASLSMRNPAPRAGTDIAIGNPYRTSDVHASHYGATSAVMGFALDKLHEKYPEIDRKFAARFLEMVLVTGAEVPLMTYSHEMGHYRAASAAGASPSIEMTGWMSGLTHYGVPPGTRLTDKQDIAADAAGVNQEQLNAVYMYQKFARNGGARYEEAMGYLLAETNLALYAANTARRTLGHDVKSSDDIANYIEGIEKRGHDVKLGHLVAMTLAADLVSAPVWASLIGQIRYLASGDRTVEMPTFEIGDVKATFPNAHVLLSSDGPIVGANVVVSPDRKVPVEVSFDVRVDKEKAAALGAKLYDVPLAGGVTVNPFFRASYDERRGPGVLVGTDVQAKVAGNLAITGSVAFRHNDLLDEPEGKSNGVDVRVGVSIPF